MSAFVPHWKLVVGGLHRCEVCGAFVERAWCYFARPALRTHCFCEPCAEAER